MATLRVVAWLFVRGGSDRFSASKDKYGPGVSIAPGPVAHWVAWHASETPSRAEHGPGGVFLFHRVIVRKVAKAEGKLRPLAA